MNGTDPIIDKIKASLGGNLALLPGLVARGAHKGLPQDAQDAIEKLAAEQTRLATARAPIPRESVADIGSGGITAVQSQGHGKILEGLDMLIRSLVQAPAAAASGLAASSEAMAGPPLTAPEQQVRLAAERTSPLKRGRDLLTEFGHAVTVGLMDAPVLENVEAQQSWNTIVKPLVQLGAMMAQGRTVVSALGYFSKIPRVTPILEMLPQRLKEVGAGAVVGGAVDAMRSDGLTDDPPWYDPSAKIARKLADAGLPDRVALFAGGASVGSILGASVLGVARGIQAGRESQYISQLANDPDLLKSMKLALTESGVQVPDAMQPRQVAKLFTSLRKASLDETLAGTVGDRLARENFVTQEIFGSANVAPSDEDSRLIAGIFRTNTGGVSVVKQVELQPRPWERLQVAEHDLTGQMEIRTNITKPLVPRTVVEEASDRLGLRLQFMRVRSGQRTVVAPPTAQASADETLIGLAYKTQDGRVYAQGDASGGHPAILQNAYKVGKNPALFQELTDDDAANVGIGRGFLTSNRRFVSRKEGLDIIKRQRDNFESTRTVATSRDVGAKMSDLPWGLVKEASQTEQAVPLYDLIISRPKYEYPKLDAVGKKSKAISGAIRSLASEQVSTLGQTVSKEAWLLPDGTPVRGGFKLTDIEKKARLQQPVISGAQRPDLALRIQGKVARMELTETGKIKVELPPSITQDQFDSIGRMFDARAFDEVTLIAHDGRQTVLRNPFGSQMQDAVTKYVAPTKTSTRLTPQLVQQYKSQGVYNGQAAVLDDGTPVSIIRKYGKQSAPDSPGPNLWRYEVRDPLTGETKNVHPSRLTELPTTLEGEYKPSNMFNEALNPEERAAFARVRQALSAGLGKEIKTFRQLESFASSRGFVANSLAAGKIELTHAASGETRAFTSRKAAIEFVRTVNGPMPELTPSEVTQLLGGDNNVGYIGGGGAPPRFGETLQLPWTKMLSTLEEIEPGKGPGMISQMLKPSLALMEHIDNKLGTNTLPVFMRLQSQHVHQTNFVAKWYKGLGSKLPDGVESLQKIQRMGGDSADWELVTHIREANPDTPEYLKLVAQAKPGELQAAKALDKWYDAMFTELGVEADYVQRYAPHWRANGSKYGNQPAQIWQALGNDPMQLPKGVQFYADQYRSGTLDIYDEHALRTAAAYLQQGASNRYMKEAFDEAAKYVMILGEKNRQAALPLANVIHAMKGTEFLDQRAALQETMRDLLSRLPGGALSNAEKDVADRMVNVALGTVYASAFGMRGSAALRNAFSAVYMSWPVFAGRRSDWIESIGRAMTTEGKMAAVEDAAIALKQSSMFMREEVVSAMPKNYEWLVDKTMWMYDSADEFTRATSYWSGRIAAEKALTKFAKGVQGASASKIETLKKTLIADSGMWLHDQQVIDNFLRRAASNPETAARYAGKLASDVTNFLYGRGMQPRWMRSVPGRFFGQFGTWSLWYIDYLRRIAGRALTTAESPYRMQAIATLARHALVNGAVVAAGTKVLDVDLSRWASYGSLFYSGGPGFQVAIGASTLVRGLGETVSGSEDPLASARVSEGSQMLMQTMRSFVPFYGAAKEAIRFGSSDDPVDRLAAVLGTRPTRDYDLKRKLSLLLGLETQQFSSDGLATEQLLNARGSNPQDPNIVDIRTATQLRQGQSGVPVRQTPTGQPGVAQPPQSRQGTNLTRSLQRIKANVPPAIAFPKGTEVTKGAEARQPDQF